MNYLLFFIYTFEMIDAMNCSSFWDETFSDNYLMSSLLVMDCQLLVPDEVDFAQDRTVNEAVISSTQMNSLFQ